MPALNSAYHGRRVMITGGLGFIGSNLARALVALDANVLLVDSLIPDYGGNLFNIDGIADRVLVNIADVRQSSTMGTCRLSSGRRTRRPSTSAASTPRRPSHGGDRLAADHHAARGPGWHYRVLSRALRSLRPRRTGAVG